MSSNSFINRKSKIAAFAAVLMFTVLVLFFMLASLFTDTQHLPYRNIVDEKTKDAYRSNSANSAYLYENAVQAKLDTLNILDKQFGEHITATGKGALSLDSLGNIISIQETALAVLLDSIQQVTDLSSSASSSRRLLMFNSFLNNRNTTARLRNAVLLHNGGKFSADEKAMMYLKNQLNEKNSRITVMQNELAQMEKDKQTPVPKAVPLTDSNVGNSTVAALENNIASLNSLNSNLRRENERLLHLQDERVKNSQTAEVQWKEKNGTLQSRMQDLQAELLLARVDCNLSRVDATDIISTSKQRKQLLTEASGILTSLANSSSPDLKSKVKQKILKLNQVAANTRE